MKLENLFLIQAYLGHTNKNWNFTMSNYIYGCKNKVHIIDLVQTLICLEKVVRFVEKLKRRKDLCEISRVILLILKFYNFSYFLLLLDD